MEGSIDTLALLVHLGSGAFGGWMAGRRCVRLGLRVPGVLLAGAIGGALGGQVTERAVGLAPVALTEQMALQPGAIAIVAAGGALGGVLVVATVGLLRQLLATSAE